MICKHCGDEFTPTTNKHVGYINACRNQHCIEERQAYSEDIEDLIELVLEAGNSVP